MIKEDVTFYLVILLPILFLITARYIKKNNERLHQEALAKLQQEEVYIKTILDQLPVSGDTSLDIYRRITLETQIRSLLEQKALSELKKEEIATSIMNANNISNSIQHQNIYNINK